MAGGSVKGARRRAGVVSFETGAKGVSSRGELMGCRVQPPNKALQRSLAVGMSSANENPRAPAMPTTSAAEFKR